MYSRSSSRLLVPHLDTLGRSQGRGLPCACVVVGNFTVGTRPLLPTLNQLPASDTYSMVQQRVSGVECQTISLVAPVLSLSSYSQRHGHPFSLDRVQGWRGGERREGMEGKEWSSMMYIGVCKAIGHVAVYSGDGQYLHDYAVSPYPPNPLLSSYPG